MGIGCCREMLFPAPVIHPDIGCSKARRYRVLLNCPLYEKVCTKGLPCELDGRYGARQLPRRGKAQPAFYDSLRQMLSYFHTNAYGEHLRTALLKAQTFAAGDQITDSLAAQVRWLLTKDRLLNNNRISCAKVKPYCSFMVEVLQRLPAEKNTDTSARIDCLAAVYYVKGAMDTAMALLQASAAIKEQLYGTESLDYAITLYQMSFIPANGGNSPEIDENRVYQALTITERTASTQNEWYAKMLEKLAWQYVQKKVHKDILTEYTAAHQYALQAVAVWKSIRDKDRLGYITHLCDASLLFGYLYDYATSLALAEESAAVAKVVLGPGHLQYAQCLQQVGHMYYVIGNYDKAVACFQKALSIQEKAFGKDYVDNVLSMHNLAVTYIQTGEYERAMPLLENVIRIQDKIPYHREYYAYELNWQAYLYQIIGDYNKAFPLYRQALQITKEAVGENTLRYAQILKNTGNCYRAIKDYPKAVKCLNTVLSIIEQRSGDHSPDYATALSSLAALYKEMDRCDSALLLITKALNIRKKSFGEAHPDYAASLNQLGEVYLRQHAYTKAHDLFTRSLLISKSILSETHPTYITILNNLGICKMEMRQPDEAFSLLTSASHLRLNHLSHTYTSLSEEEKLAMINEEYYQFSYIPSLLLKIQNKVAAVIQQVYRNELTLKGMVLHNQQTVLKSIRASSDSSTLQLYYSWQNNKSIIGKKLLQLMQTQLAGLNSLQRITNWQEQELSRRSAGYISQSGVQPVSGTTIASRLQPGEAAIEYLTFRVYNHQWTRTTQYAALLLLPGDSTPAFIPLCSEKRLQEMVQSYEKQVFKVLSRRTGSKPGLTIYDSVYRVVWQPLERYLNNVHTVYFAPAGLLNRIAFGALPCKNARSLVDSYELRQLMSTRALSSPFPMDSISHMSIWGNIEYNFYSKTPPASTTDTAALAFLNSTTVMRNGGYTKSWHELPGTKLEIDSIRYLVSQAKLTMTEITDTAATEEAFKAMDGNSPQVLHIATHGFFLPAPKTSAEMDNGERSNVFAVQKDAMFRSGLVLAGGNLAWKGNAPAGREDGILTAYEILKARP